MKNPILMCRRLLLAGIALAAMTGSCLRADGPTPYPDPKDQAAWKGTGPIRVFPWMSGNRDSFWTQRDAKQGAVVLVGDSLIGNWDITPKVKTAKAFPKLKNVANRGIGGDVTRGVLFRLKEDVLDLHPEALVMLIGTNDLSAQGPIDGIASNLTAILDQAQAAYPDMPIIICKIPPRANPAAKIDDSMVTQLNAKIDALAQGRKNVTVFDTFTLFATPDGKPDPANYQKDLLHPSDAGYQKFGDGLGKVFDQLGLK